MQKRQVWSLDWEDSLEKEMATHSSILAWKIPCTEELGGLQSMGSQRVRHDLATNQQQQSTQLLADIWDFHLILNWKLDLELWSVSKPTYWKLDLETIWVEVRFLHQPGDTQQVQSRPQRELALKTRPLQVAALGGQLVCTCSGHSQAQLGPSSHAWWPVPWTL